MEVEEKKKKKGFTQTICYLCRDTSSPYISISIFV